MWAPSLATPQLGDLPAQSLLRFVLSGQEPIIHALNGLDDAVELDVKRQRVAVLGVLKHKDHQEGDDRGDRVGIELPGIGPGKLDR